MSGLCLERSLCSIKGLCSNGGLRNEVRAFGFSVNRLGSLIEHKRPLLEVLLAVEDYRV